MTFEEAMVAARLELPVIHWYVDGCTRVEIEGGKIVQVGYSFKNGVQSEFVQILEKANNVTYTRLENVRLADFDALKNWRKEVIRKDA